MLLGYKNPQVTFACLIVKVTQYVALYLTLRFENEDPMELMEST